MNRATRFDGKVAMITGGASGIGEAVARKLAAQGAAVVIGDVQQAKARALIAELGDAASYLPLDVTSERDWAAMREHIVQRHRRLDVLVNSAGIGGFGSIEDTTAEQWLRVMGVNAMGVFLGCKLAVDLMQHNGGGAIVNVASAMAVRADALQLSYCSSKAAILNLTRSVAMHCGKQNYNIRCNSVLPGAIDTPLLRTMESSFGSSAELESAMGALHILNRMGTTEEVADAILFLASSEASFVTAANIAIDGGMAEMWSGSRMD